MSNSEWLARQELMESTDVTAVDICLSGWMKRKDPSTPHPRTASSHFGCCCLRKETRSATQMKNTRSMNTNYKVF